jgi:hypothetical protein
LYFVSLAKLQTKNKKSSKFRQNQKIRRKSEKCLNFRNFPCFSEDLATLELKQRCAIRYKYILLYGVKDNNVKTEMIERIRFINRVRYLKLTFFLQIYLSISIVLRSDGDFEMFIFRVFYWTIIPD